MRTYIYYCEISKGKFDGLGRQVTLASDTKLAEKRETSKSVQQVGWGMSAMASAIVIGRNPSLAPRAIQMSIGSMEMLKAQGDRNPYGIFYTGDENCQVNIDTGKVKGVVPIEDGEQERYWVDRSKTAIGKISDMDMTTLHPVNVRHVFAVSVIPPEVVFKKGKISHALITTELEDAQALIQSKDLIWPDVAIAEIPKSEGDLISLIPLSKAYRVSPEYLLQDKESNAYKALLKQQRHLVAQAHEIFNRRYKIETNPDFTTRIFKSSFAQVFFHMPKEFKDYEKIHEEYGKAAEEYLVALKDAIKEEMDSFDRDDEYNDLIKLLDMSIFEETPYHKLSELSDDDIANIDVEDILLDPDEIKLTEKAEKEIHEAKRFKECVDTYYSGAREHAIRLYRETLGKVIKEYEPHCKSYADYTQLFNTMNKKIEVAKELRAGPGLSPPQSFSP